MAVAPSLQVLLAQIIDYAGTFPPASLPCQTAIDNYFRYRAGKHAWMLRGLVVAAADLPKVPKELNGSLAVLSDMDEPRATTIETRRVFRARKPVYCEVAISELDEVKRAGCYAKLRTGGVQPELIPSIEAVAEFLLACANRRLAFKATAGLHHPIRSSQPLTYDPEPARAVLHGFINVFMAAAFAWHGKRDLVPILSETDPTTFRFDNQACWRDWSLSIDQLRKARREFAHSFGSCSFEEPIHDLQTLGLL
jgi:hypothetical protein